MAYKDPDESRSKSRARWAANRERHSAQRTAAYAADRENKQAENRAAVILAEAEVPRAIADAFRSGNLGVMDYYKLRNVQADTSMREAIAKPPEGPKTTG